jgi:hypothetical protein
MNMRNQSRSSAATLQPGAYVVHQMLLHLGAEGPVVHRLEMVGDVRQLRLRHGWTWITQDQVRAAKPTGVAC